ncbi:MAG: cold shock domain-containing protein [Verrucomicrobia bacterium]|nr:cold shock domain-containing protein [Verrucomicrobiota bacterium]
MSGSAVTAQKCTGLKKTTEAIEWREAGSAALSGGNGNNPWSGGPTVDMKTGVVKFFNEAKGFGFIKEDGGQEVAKHYITIPHNLSKVKALGANGEGKKEFNFFNQAKYR